MRAKLSILLVAFAQLGAVTAAQEQPAIVSPGTAGVTTWIMHVTVIGTETGQAAAPGWSAKPQFPSQIRPHLRAPGALKIPNRRQ